MTRGFRFQRPDVRGAMASVRGDLERATTKAMDEVTDGLKNELRAQITASGMGGRLANTWRGRRYPVGGVSLGASAFVFSKAPEIVDAFDRAPVIRPVNGARYLAIPTENVPRSKNGAGRRGGSRRMTPFEVETYFNQDLKFARAPQGRLVAYIDAEGRFAPTVMGRPKPTFAPMNAKRLARFYRTGKAPKRLTRVAMFILTPVARMPRRLNVDDAANHWAGAVEPILGRHLDQIAAARRG